MQNSQHNINNWHWEEKNYSEWGIDRLKEILTWTYKASETCEVTFTKEKITGDVFIYNRKNKLHLVYQLKCEIKFSIKDAGYDIIEGTLFVEPFVDEEEDEWDFVVRVKDTFKHSSEQLLKVQTLVSRKVFISQFNTFKKEFEQIFEKLKNEK